MFLPSVRCRTWALQSSLWSPPLAALSLCAGKTRRKGGSDEMLVYDNKVERVLIHTSYEVARTKGTFKNKLWAGQTNVGALPCFYAVVRWFCSGGKWFHILPQLCRKMNCPRRSMLIKMSKGHFHDQNNNHRKSMKGVKKKKKKGCPCHWKMKALAILNNRCANRLKPPIISSSSLILKPGLNRQHLFVFDCEFGIRQTTKIKEF